MKKIISLGIASAVLAMTAISASAGVVVKTDSAVTPGATITVQFVADADSDAISFRTEATGADLVDASAPNAGALVMVSDDKKGFASLAGVKNGDVLFTQTYTVTAAEGQPVNINVVDLQGTTGVATNLSVTVTTTSTSEPSTSEPSTSEPSTPSTSEPSTPSTSESSTPSTSNPGDDQNPSTGIALAVFPAVIAGAAVVVAKKKRG